MAGPGWIAATASVFILATKPEALLQIGEPLGRAERALAFAGSCVQDSTDSEEENALSARERAVRAAATLAEGIWGGRFPGIAPEEPRTSLPCSSRNVAEALNEADAAVAEAVGLIDQHSTPLRHGSWIGPLHLCRESVARASMTQDALTGQVAVSITLRDDAASLLADITATRIDMPLPHRIDGKVVGQPMINERLTSPSFQMTGAEESILRRAVKAMEEPC